MTKSRALEELAEWLFWYDTKWKDTNTKAAPLLLNRLEELGFLPPGKPGSEVTASTLDGKPVGTMFTEHNWEPEDDEAANG